MNPHGYGYSLPHGYLPGIPPTNESQPAQSSSYTHTADVGGQPTSHEEFAKQSFEYNRSVIPGLGLNLSHGALQQTPSTGFASQVAMPDPQSSHLPTGSWGREDGRTASGNPSTVPIATFPPNQGSEEGELSDGVLEDFYEPRESDDIDDLAPYDPSQPSNTHLQGRYGTVPHKSHLMDLDGDATANAGPYASVRERSGSYSPYLSPREMNSGQSVGSPYSAQDASPSSAREEEDGHIPIGEPTANFPLDQPTTLAGEVLPVKSIDQAKSDAMDAISSLWPFKIRYQDYIAEGIDGGLVTDLFASLGFDTGRSSMRVSDSPHPMSTTQDISAQSRPISSAITTEAQMPKTAPVPDNHTHDSLSQTEERKDKIARLLAAKATKPSVAPVAKPAPTTTEPSPTKNANTKTQAEKSKLLQQKMEALRKSREALASKTTEAHDQDATLKVAGDVADDTPAIGSLGVDGSVDASSNEVSRAISDTSESLEDADAQAASSIPGLFLSSTPQPGTNTTSHKRPVASDFDHTSSGSFKRPFGQNRDSRPFLIDVSDDEDDAEMEIDSPELHPTTLHRQRTPPRTTASSREVLKELSASHSVVSPATILTPPQGVSGIHGRPDLENMNKKIEEMKRKIAEAEARKRAKQSRPGSMTPSQQNGVSDIDSPGLTSIETPNAPSSPATAMNSGKNTAQDLPGIESPPLSVAKRSGIVGRHREERATRSRAASERISLIEAHRRQQLFKLEALRSQVADIEKDIEDSRLEEERLMKEATATPEPEIEANPTLDTGSIDFIPGNEVLAPGQESLSPAIDATEISTTSSSSFDANAAATGNDQGLMVAADQETVQMLTSEAQTPNEAVDDLVQAEQVSATHTANLVSEASTHLDDHPTDTVPAVEDEAMHEEGSEDMSDDYEPPDAGSTTSMSHSPQALAADNPDSSVKDLVLADEHEEQTSSSSPAPSVQKISLGQEETTSEAVGKFDEAGDTPAQELPRPHPGPYETPLRCFRAFRFHPLYKDTVSGGIRSLTYSNKIDVHNPLCPDQQVGRECPRGNACQFQHFDSMQVSDSQIVTVLTEYGNFEAEEKHRYINGLRELLTDLRNRKVKDLDAISQGIIGFRAQFLGDKSRVLPLGSVSL